MLKNARILIFVCIMGLVSTIKAPILVIVQLAGKDSIVKMVNLIFVILQNKKFKSMLQVSGVKTTFRRWRIHSFRFFWMQVDTIDLFRKFFYYILLITILILDINECNVKDLCKHNGTCINNNGSYVCNCSEGWQGQHCEDG